jgi:uncharacterized protein YndB with AHSA1/START domain
MTKTIRHNVTIGAAPRQVFDALIRERKHAKFTGAPASISRKVGGAFTCYGGHISGINLELVPAKRIVQAWRAKDWPAGIHSIVSFALSREAGGRTRISFAHVGVPASRFKDINEGWRTYYWKPLKAYLGR